MSFLWETEEGQDLLGPHPNLIAWIKRMEARPSLRNTQWDRLTELVGG
jgi:glutathione S-transferase